MASRVAYFNGSIVPEGEARVSIFDSALTVGDMAFEVTRTCRGVPFRLAEHLRRSFIHRWTPMNADLDANDER